MCSHRPPTCIAFHPRLTLDTCGDSHSSPGPIVTIVYIDVLVSIGCLTSFNTHARHYTRAAEFAVVIGANYNGGPTWNRARMDAKIAADGLSSYDIQGNGNCLMMFECVCVPHSVGSRKENRWRGSACV